MRLLLEQGADPNRGNHFGKTPLMYAAHFNLLESARLLLKYGADPNRRTTAKADRVCNSFKWIGRTALMYAAENADEAMMALLIEAGADIEARDLVDYWRGPGTPDRSVHDYLDLNANLSLAEKAQISARWGLSALPGAN